MDSEEIVEGEWWEAAQPPPSHEVPAAIRARARLAQGVALRDMTSSWQRSGRLVSEPSPRLMVVGSSKPLAPAWLASCGGNRSERARAAEIVAMNDFLSRPSRPHPPLRSI